MHSIYRKPWTSTIRTQFSLQSTSSTEDVISTDCMQFQWSKLKITEQAYCVMEFLSFFLCGDILYVMFLKYLAL